MFYLAMRPARALAFLVCLLAVAACAPQSNDFLSNIHYDYDTRASTGTLSGGAD